MVLEQNTVHMNDVVQKADHFITHMEHWHLESGSQNDSLSSEDFHGLSWGQNDSFNRVRLSEPKWLIQHVKIKVGEK